MADGPPSVPIYKWREADGSIRELSAHLDHGGDLILSGWHSGAKTVALLGREEYEFWIRVRSQDVPRLCLQLLRERYVDAPEASSAFLQWIDRLGIPHGFSTFSAETAQVRHPDDGAPAG